MPRAPSAVASRSRCYVHFPCALEMSRIAASFIFSLAAACWLTSARVNGQEGDTSILTLRGEGPAETQLPMLQAFHMFKDSMGVPVQVFYRNTSSPAAAASLAADAGNQPPSGSSSSAGALQFAISERPLTAAQRANFSVASGTAAGHSVHFPLFVNVYGLFHNVPGNVQTPINITACLMARILKGEISYWTNPDLLEKNPNFYKAATGSYQIVVLVDSATSGATLAVLSWLAAACPSVPVTYASLRSDALAVGSNLVAKLLSTPYSLGWAMASVGHAASLPELAVETGIPGQFVVTGGSNATAMYQRLAATVPTTLTGDYSSVSVSALPAADVAPILTVAYLITRSTWSQTDAEAQRGEAVRALCRFFLSDPIASSTTGVITKHGMLPLGSTTITAIASASSTAFTTLPSAVRYDFIDGNGENVLTPTRSSYEVLSFQEVDSQITSLKQHVGRGAARVLRGAGSSAVALFVWRCFSDIKARSTSPMHLVYRAAGSGAGQSEVVAKETRYQAAVDFGISDTPMPDALYADLTTTARTTMVHVPLLLTAMTFYVNIPSTILLARQLKLSPCTLAKIMQGDITAWSHPDITADAGFSLPNKTITVFYRNASSGTTAIISAYLAANCPDWRLGSGTLLTGWPAAAVPVATGLRMAASLGPTPWSIGYMDTGNGRVASAVEVAVLNKAGNYVTSATGDVAAAAASLLRSDSWPRTPTQPFSAVSVLNQPGATTFPIVAMPFMFVRTDLTDRGDAGALLEALVTFVLSKDYQDAIASSSGHAPLPEDVRQYTLERVLPLILTDTRAVTWTFEGDSVLPAGRGGADGVISSFAGSFESTAAAFFTDFLRAYTAAQQAQLLVATGNASSANASASAASSGATAGAAGAAHELQSEVAGLKKQVAILEALAITAICFGVAGMSLAMLASCRVFVRSTLLFGFAPHGGGGGGGGASSSAVHPSANSSKFGETSSVRRQKSMGNISDNSLTGVDI